MSGLANDIDWDDAEERSWWSRATDHLLFVGSGVCWASLSVASWLSPLLSLAIPTHDRSPGDADRDL
jgi:hypothetical protein